MKTIQIIVAVDANFGIGLDNDIPFKHPADLQLFKQHTTLTDMVMGRKTFDSLPGILPGRHHIVITSKSRDNMPGVSFVNDFDSVESVMKTDTLSVIGGRSIYEHYLPLTHTLHLTEFPDVYHCDTICMCVADIANYEDDAWYVADRHTHVEAGKDIFLYTQFKRKPNDD